MSDTGELFAMAAVWVLVAAVIVRFVPNKWGRIVSFGVLVGIPFWELPYGYYNFQKLCNEEGGLKIFETIPSQNTVCASYPFETSAEYLLKLGFLGVEARDESGRVRRFAKESSDRQATIDGKQISSKYCVTQAFVQGLPWRIQRNEYVIAGALDQRIVARHSDFVWFGTWWQQQTLPILGVGGECRHSDPVKAIAAALLVGTK